VVVAALDRAWERRAALRERLAGEGTDALRLFTGAEEGIAGLVLDCYRSVIVAQERQGESSFTDEQWEVIGRWCLARPGIESVYRKRIAVDRSMQLAEPAMYEATPFAGAVAPSRVAVREHAVTYLIEPYGGFSTGLFLDQRENRHFLARLAAGKSVLNTFAYSCGFSVAAARAGARTTSVDLSRKWLDWGVENFRANGLDPGPHRFIADDCFAYFARAARRGERFDIVIVDPPSFARGKKGTFSIRKDLPRLLDATATLVAPGGYLFLSSNLAEWRSAGLAERVAVLLGSEAERSLPPVPEDFRPSETPLAACLFQLA
jgi:23S rRNA (cytosine1962-C5)-methyltransferase